MKKYIFFLIFKDSIRPVNLSTPIWLEMKFPREYVISELRSFQPHYEKEFFNLKEIICCLMMKGKRCRWLTDVSYQS